MTTILSAPIGVDVFGTYDAKILEDEFFPAASRNAELRLSISSHPDFDRRTARVADVEIDTAQHVVDSVDFDSRYVEGMLDGLGAGEIYLELEDAEKALHSSYREAVGDPPGYPADLGFVEEAETALEEYGLDFQI